MRVRFSNASLWKWAVVLVIVLGTSVGLVRALTMDSAPVEIYVQNSSGSGARLRVPVEYLPSRDDRAGGLSDGLIRLLASYPDMSPAARRGDDSKRSDYSIQPLRFETLVQIRAAAPNSIAVIFSDRVKHEHLVRDANEPGFSMYRAVWAGQTREYLVPIDQDRKYGPIGTVFDCGPYVDSSMTKRLWSVCVGHVQPIDRFYVEYEIPRQAVDQWREVENRVLSLIRSFVVDCFEGPELDGGNEPDKFHECKF